jgi:RNA recognition motif-containing protein
MRNLGNEKANISSYIYENVNMNLFITGLPYDVSDQELKQLFEEFGTVSSARVIMDRETGKSRGFGFVEMPDAAAAEKAMKELSDSELSGRRLTVKVAEERKNKPDGGRGDNRSGGYNKGGYDKDRKRW